MSKRHRLGAFIIAVMMVFSMVITASAVEFGDVKNTANNKRLYDAVKLLQDLSIIKGYAIDDADPSKGLDFKPENIVTRQEMAMFIARIKTGTPETFVNQTRETMPLDFKDDKQIPDWSRAAIAYCIDEGIINGYPDGTFQPTRTVNYQEAVKMMVTALGYQNLQFPYGFITRGNELGLTEGFETVQITKDMQRQDIAVLLYNMFFAEEVYPDVVTNSQTGIQTAIIAYRSVASRFGIEICEAYITGVEGYAATIVVDDDKLEGLSAPLDKRVFEGQALTAKQAAAGQNLEIQFFTNYSTTTGGVITRGNYGKMILNKDTIGLKDVSGKDLLGLKIIYYRNITSNKELKLPDPYIVGSKTTVDTSGKSGKMSATLNSDYDEVIEIVINDKIYNQKKPYDLNGDSSTPKLYTYGDSARMTKVASGDSATVLNFARQVDQNGYYKLELVDNGINKNVKNGVAETYYIYTPYKVAYVEELKDSSGNLVLSEGKTDGKGLREQIAYKADDLIYNRYSGSNISFAKGNAYLYTKEDSYIEVYATLTPVLKNVDISYSSEETAVIGTATYKFDKTTGYLAVGGILNAKDNFRVGNVYTLYAYASGGTPFFAVPVVKADTTIYPKEYAIVISDNGSVTTTGGKVGRAATVFRQDTNKTETVIFSEINGGSPASLTAGTAIAFTRVGDFYHAWTEGRAGFGNVGEDVNITESKKWQYDNRGILISGGASGLASNETGMVKRSVPTLPVTPGADTNTDYEIDDTNTGLSKGTFTSLDTGSSDAGQLDALAATGLQNVLNKALYDVTIATVTDSGAADKSGAYTWTAVSDNPSVATLVAASGTQATAPAITALSTGTANITITVTVNMGGGATPDDVATLVVPVEVIGNTSYIAGWVYAGGEFDYNQSSGLIKTYPNKTSIINAQTRIIVVKSDGSQAMAINKNQFDSLVFSSTAKIYKLTLVTYTANGSAAHTVIAYVESGSDTSVFGGGSTPIEQAKYAMIKSIAGSLKSNDGVTYNLVQVYNYTDGVNEELAIANSVSIAVGQVISVTDKVAVAGGITKTIAEAAVSSGWADKSNASWLANFTTDISVIKNLMTTNNALKNYTKNVSATYGASDYVALNNKDVNIITVKIRADKGANLTNGSNWTLVGAGWNVEVSMDKGNIDSRDYTNIKTEITGSGLGQQYYIIPYDVEYGGGSTTSDTIGDFITIIKVEIVYP